MARDLLAPRYRLTGNDGDVLGPEITQFITKVEYEDESEMTDMLRITLSEVGIGARGLDRTIQETKLLKEGNQLLLEGGYGDTLQPIGKVDIVKRRKRFPRGEYPTVEIIGYDPFHRLSAHVPRRGVSYKAFRDSQIATIMASRHNIDFSKVRRQADKFDRVQKKGVNDFEFLKHVADIRGLDLFLRYDKTINNHRMYFEEPRDRQKQTFTFKYDIDPDAVDLTLFEFMPDVNTLEQPSDVEIITFDKKQGTKKRVLLTAADLNTQDDVKAKGKDKFKKAKPLKSGSAVRAKAFGQTFEVIADKPFKNEKEARDFVVQYLRKRKESFIIGDATLLGLETLQSRQTHLFDGLDDQFNGKYYFTRVKHIFTPSDYQCTANVRRVVED